MPSDDERPNRGGTQLNCFVARTLFMSKGLGFGLVECLVLYSLDAFVYLCHCFLFYRLEG